MVAVRVTHTSQLTADELGAAEHLLYAVFEDLEPEDWEHALGGMHATAWEDGALIGHAAIVQRRLLHRGVTLRAGYVEGVAVRQDRRRRGVASALMHAIEEMARRAYDVAALGATDEAAPLYAGRGWQVWRGSLSALTPAGIRPTPEESGAVYVLRLSAPLDLDAELTCDWREGDGW